MTNLIPPIGQKAIVREYWLRTLSVWAILLTIVAVLGAVLLLPTYVLVQAQQRALDGQIGEANRAEITVLEQDARTTNILAGLLAARTNDVSFEALITEAGAVAPEGISPLAYTITRADTDPRALTLKIEGIAASRTALQAFEDALEGMDGVESVDIPLSDLVRGVDVQFAATVLFKLPPQ